MCVIEYDIANRDSQSGSPIRLITTILNPEQASAAELAAVYHQRWEFESSLAEILARPNPPRRLRPYPRVTKRASGSKFPRKRIDHNNVRHRAPPDIRLTRLHS